jgi:hypothetical protein
MPNRLGYCGPEEDQPLLKYLVDAQSDHGLQQILARFWLSPINRGGGIRSLGGEHSLGGQEGLAGKSGRARALYCA